jgi:hypothetical protein
MVLRTVTEEAVLQMQGAKQAEQTHHRICQSNVRRDVWAVQLLMWDPSKPAAAPVALITPSPPKLLQHSTVHPGCPCHNGAVLWR